MIHTCSTSASLTTNTSSLSFHLPSIEVLRDHRSTRSPASALAEQQHRPRKEAAVGVLGAGLLHPPVVRELPSNSLPPRSI